MAALWAVSDAPLHRKVSDASMAAAAKFGFSCLLLRASAAAEARGRGAEIDPGDFGIQIIKSMRRPAICKLGPAQMPTARATRIIYLRYFWTLKSL